MLLCALRPSISQSICWHDSHLIIPKSLDWMQGAYIACNVYIKNLQRIEDMVGSALQRWMVEHNRYDAPDSL